MMKTTRSILFCFLFVSALSCGAKKETVPVSDAPSDQAFQELDTSAMCYYKGGALQWKLESRHMKKYIADTGRVVANPVVFSVYDSLGKESTRVLSDSGATDAAMKSFCVWGNVFVKAQNGVRVRSQRLYFNFNSHRITSRDYVQIKTLKGDVLQGKGLDAAEDFSWWKFEKDVSGRFPNFKERMEKGDNFSF
jgi:LPS export ABC transporter protein LptC